MNSSLYDNWAKYYDPEDTENNIIKECAQRLNGTIDNNAFWKDKNVLEIGAGTGRFTKKIIDDVSSIVAIDIDKERISWLKNKLSDRAGKDKLVCFDTDLLVLLRETNYFSDKKFDIIIFSWSWAFLEDKHKEEMLSAAMSLLADNGTIVVTMVVGGNYEKMMYNLSKDNNLPYEDELQRNIVALDVLRELLKSYKVIVAEDEISTYFSFPDKKTAIEIVKEQIDLDEDLISRAIDKFVSEKEVKIDDISRCICIRKLSNEELRHKAKITFNYKLCDNRGQCSAAAECKKYRSAIVRNQEANAWEVIVDRCNECRKCVNICELFTVHRFWSEMFEKIRKIENTTVEPDFFDKDRYGSGAYNYTHLIKGIEDLFKVVYDDNRVLSIIEVDDGAHLASSFDSVLITDFISKSLYDKYFYKCIVRHSADLITNDTKLGEETRHNKDCEQILERLEINELPALIIVHRGQIVCRLEGGCRMVDKAMVEHFKSTITNAISDILKVDEL